MNRGLKIILCITLSLFAFELCAQKFDFLPVAEGDQVVEHKYYFISFNPEYKQARWVAYHFKREDLKVGADFKIEINPDPEMPGVEFLTEKDIKKSKQQMGFMAPEEDMNFSYIAWVEGHFASNLTAMDPDFYEKTWDMVNQVVRSHVRTDDDLFVVSGPIFDENSLERGDGKVHVPKAFFRVLLDYSQPNVKMIGYILPNEGGFKIIKNLAVPVDEIEKLTGIDFFPALPDDLENQLEEKVNLEGWFVK